MSQLLGNFEAYIRTLPSPNVRVVVGQSALTDETPMRADVAANQGSRDLVEDGGITAVDVGGPSTGRFTCFLDVMQRPKGPVYINCSVPIMYGYVAAAVRTRGADRRMRTLEGFHEVDEALYYPKKLAEEHSFVISGVPCVDTEDEKTPLIEHPLALVQAAYDRISNRRNRVESRLAEKWVRENSGGDWLLVDGGLNSDFGEAGKIVGVTKSHGTQYLTFEEQQEVLALKVGERSGAFVPKTKSGARPVYSWYLRMHASEGRDPYFGLVRVEAPRSKRALDMIDEISRWLLAERAPLSLPDSRWDKMIYPIRDCEQFMKSVAPTHTSLDARLMRLGSLGQV